MKSSARSSCSDGRSQDWSRWHRIDGVAHSEDELAKSRSAAASAVMIAHRRGLVPSREQGSAHKRPLLRSFCYMRKLDFTKTVLGLQNGCTDQ